MGGCTPHSSFFLQAPHRFILCNNTMKANSDSQFVVPVTIAPHTPKLRGVKEIVGHYIHVGKVFLPTGGVELESRQFLGVHDESVVLTVVRPAGIRAMIQLVREMPKLPRRGRVVWLGGVKLYKEGQGIKAYVPNSIWNPAGEEFRSIWRDIGCAYWHAASGKAEPYFLVDLPSITPGMSLR